MATTDNSFNGITEYCDECGLETIHEVSVQIRTESVKQENAQFSREPYRVSECQRCGTRTSQRMNNA
ncbi:DUF7835 family putative zinc beta-ribbon protein [Natronobacterium gregoryi]|uniref:DUF7835 domain-containing protein n=2 Tax=Natronobacterium gregoryi TaxID=44930 RepID=L0AEL4_NATGS|nr:hypothetical protein [Natronobacterium gregoryi]AFZ72348.1 hypothetical protein Natgr_1120 [Natronobacterium gregoryi SP2]ELY64266.1 hypothetical protein C490_14795 [Natronobacterium gregoryi SP2]PLK20336.1 hypothetical protein CYV19_10260 [Natronobacterium gregoryi SP2]SFJ22945.1 hypothetical protein SAMN05443661_11849 [Natronobacterium gregoryi]